MYLEIVVSSSKLSVILSDLSRKRAIIKDILHRGQNKVPKLNQEQSLSDNPETPEYVYLFQIILARVPLAELAKYTSVLRSLSSGEAHMTMQPSGFALMQPNDEDVALRKIHNFE